MTPTLSVARDAFLESATIADVLDLARTMALERLARGLPVAWVGPAESSATVLHTWLAVPTHSAGQWYVWRDGFILTSTGRGFPVVLWSVRVVRGRVERAVTMLDADTYAVHGEARPAPEQP